MTTSAPHTLKQLCGIFPHFAEVWADEQAPPEDGLVDGIHYEWNHHTVLISFLEYFASNHEGFEDQQIRALCAWINDAVSVDSDLENAVSTCFLEHTRQVRVNRVLWPHLSPRAKAKSRA